MGITRYGEFRPQVNNDKKIEFNCSIEYFEHENTYEIKFVSRNKNLLDVKKHTISLEDLRNAMNVVINSCKKANQNGHNEKIVEKLVFQDSNTYSGSSLMIEGSQQNQKHYSNNNVSQVTVEPTTSHKTSSKIEISIPENFKWNDKHPLTEYYEKIGSFETDLSMAVYMEGSQKKGLTENNFKKVRVTLIHNLYCK